MSDTLDIFRTLLNAKGFGVTLRVPLGNGREADLIPLTYGRWRIGLVEKLSTYTYENVW